MPHLQVSFRKQILSRIDAHHALPVPFRREARGGSLEELQDYARQLLSSLQDPESRVKLPLVAIEVERDREREEGGGLSGCRQAVEIITRNPRKGKFLATIAWSVVVHILSHPMNSLQPLMT